MSVEADFKCVRITHRGGYEPIGSSYKLLYIARVPLKNLKPGNRSRRTRFHFGVVSEGSLGMSRFSSSQALLSTERTDHGNACIAFFSNGQNIYACDEYEVLVYDNCLNSGCGELGRYSR